MIENSTTDKDFLDSNQYSEEGIISYEFVFGENFVSSGGLEITKVILDRCNYLNENSRVLDIGSGLGGSCLYIHQKYGCFVHGVDISENMIRIAKSRNFENEKIQFEMCDILTKDFPENSFDMIFSKDSILHLPIEKKKKLFEKCRKWLRPNGILLITDYCANNPDQWDESFKDYMKKRKYTLISVEEYKRMILDCQLKEVKTEDKTSLWIECLTKELKNLEEKREEFLKRFSEKQFQILHDGWTRKIKDAKRNMQLWGYFEFIKS